MLSSSLLSSSSSSSSYYYYYYYRQHTTNKKNNKIIALSRSPTITSSSSSSSSLNLNNRQQQQQQQDRNRNSERLFLSATNNIYTTNTKTLFNNNNNNNNNNSSRRRRMFTSKSSKIEINNSEKNNESASSSSSSLSSETYVMINGITGKMGQAIAQSVTNRKGFTLCPHAFIPKDIQRNTNTKLQFGDVLVNDLFNLEKEGKEKAVAKLKELQARYTKSGSKFIVIDFTVPDAIDGNIALYLEAMVPFVCGTTGGNREKFTKDVNDAKLPAVIAPQMGKQVVALQAAIKQMAESFPGAFKGYSMRVVESHQASKVDTSGTAKALISSFNELGVGFNVNDVELIRDVNTQRDVMNIPDEYLLGHAYHTYTLTSADRTVSFEFQHNVCGRTIYAEGTVDAVGFLSRNLNREDGKTLFDMIDVLREGGMVTDANV